MAYSRTVSAAELRARWDALFDEFSWLEGLCASGSCDDVFCCPDDPQDWTVLSEVSGLLFLSGAPGPTPRLSRSLLDS